MEINLAALQMMTKAAITNENNSDPVEIDR
jgi:hypothetical protein